ncbi:MAG: ATP-dependent helicase RhlE [Betaproteobacteria bacterium]
MTTEMQFAALGLAQPLLRAITDAGYTTPTPVQVKAIPLVLAGGDLLAAAQTGTGKTAGFVLPILHRLQATAEQINGASRPGRPRCLILTPTRELAAQVEESVRTYGKHVPIKSMVMYGGVGIQPQVAQLRKRVDILVATPGRLLDHAGQRNVDLSGIEILVLDEGDRMLDMGFIHDIRRILALMPKQKQSMLFSATFSDDVRALAATLLINPASIDVSPRNTAAELVQHTVHLVKKEQKRDVLSHLIRANAWQQVLVFTRTKHGANRLAEKLERDGIAAVAIHGNKSQAARTRALAQFKAGEVPVLVATDIAARGLDIEELPHVVNFELPNVAEDYLHRIGRTGRAGSSGAAVSLVDSEEIQLLRDIEKLLKRPIERAALQGFVPVERTGSERAAEDDRRPARPSRNQRPHRDRQPQGKGTRPGSEARSTRERNGNQRNETPGNRSPSSRDDSRGNRPRASVADDGRGTRTRPVRRDDTPRHIRRDETAGNRARHIHRDEAQPNRTHRAPRDPATGHGGQPVLRDEVDGNRAQPAGESHASHTMSEAARHQAQAQPALFSPKPQQRRRG